MKYGVRVWRLLDRILVFMALYSTLLHGFCLLDCKFGPYGLFLNFST